MKNKNLVYGIVALLGLGAVIYLATGGVSLNGENGIEGFTFKCLNSQLQYVDCNTGKLLSVVGGVPGISYLEFTVTASNTGDIPLTCSNIPASPTGFVNAMDTASKIADVGSQVVWQSTPVDLTPLEALSQPVTFETTIRCKYRDGVDVITLPDQTKTIQLTITSDVVNAGFNVDFQAPDVGSVVCGDGICQIPTEDVTNCPADCSV